MDAGDTVAPEIVLFTSEIPSNYPGSPYVEEGFQAIDGCDGDITDRVVSEQKGDQVFYSVTDNSGNVATAVRDIVYREDISANGKTIYLTFDDGPGKYTEQLLDVLAKYNVKVTFFVVGTDHPQIMARIAKEGHSIGVHSYSHRLKEIYKSEEEFFADVEEMQTLIEEHTGKRTNLLRFPGGSSNSFSRYNEGIMTRLSEEVTKRGYVYFDWNVDSLDASGATTAEEVFENVKIGVEEKEISVVLQHDIKDFSVEAVEMIIQWGLENGYTFRALDESSPTCQHKIYN
jgi:peptidoglycan/xylan/chitin deacetylase (PgdA/CDA1 family)